MEPVNRVPWDGLEPEEFDDLRRACMGPDRVLCDPAASCGWGFAFLDLHGTPVAYAVGRLVADELHIDEVGTAPEQRRKGFARRGLLEVLGWAAERGARAAYLEVREHNGAAVGLYRSLGFVTVGRRNRYYADGADALLMRGELAAGAEDRTGAL